MPVAEITDYPPNGLDRADGSNGIGTPTPPGAIDVTGSEGIADGTFEESSDSPEIERAEQATISKTFHCDQNTATDLITGIGRGTIMVDSFGDYTRVLSTHYSQRKGNFADIRIVAEGLNFDPPPDEFNVEVVELNPSIFRHPRYSSVVNYQTTDSGGVVHYLGPTIIGAINNAVNQPQPQTQTEQQNLLSSLFGTDTASKAALALAQELIGKLRLGEDTFYLAGFKVTYSTYNFVPWLINPGGYIEDPVDSGNLPFYFWSDDGTPSGDNIFTTLAEDVAPQFYDQGISWLRESDSQTYQRTWFKLTETWIGGPFGQWDAQIYNSLSVPTIAYG